MGLSFERQLILAVVLVLAIWASQVTSRNLNDVSMIEKHELWMIHYGRAYRDHAEKEMRFKIFENNVEFIESFNNAGNRPYKLSVNEFADQTNEEFKAARNGFKLKSSRVTPFRYENVTAVPSSIDWRKKGAVTPVKDQGQCGTLSI